MAQHPGWNHEVHLIRGTAEKLEAFLDLKVNTFDCEVVSVQRAESDACVWTVVLRREAGR